MKMDVVLLVLAFVATMLAEVAGIGEKCEEDHECMGTGNIKEYCYNKSWQCVKCTDCKTYFRSDPENLSCAKGPEDCGSCSSGYEEIIQTTGRRHDTCSPVPSTEDSSDSSQYYILTSVGILIGFSLVSIIGFIYFYKIKKERNQNRREEHVESGMGMQKTPTGNPPRYEEILPSAPLLPASEHESDGRIIEEVDVKFSIKNNASLESHAIPFQYPRYPYSENHNPPVNDEEEANEEAPDELHIFPPNLHDEDTMESNWSPGTDPGQHTAGTAAAADDGDDGNDDGACGGVVNAEEADVTAAVNEVVNIDEVKETDREEEEASSVTDLSDSGVLCDTSSSSLSRPFAQFESTATSSMEDTCGFRRSHSDDDLSVSGTINKRQRHDDVQSLDEGTVSDM